MSLEDRMSPEQKRAWNAWVESRPKAVQELARKYPPGTKFNFHGRTMFVMSYDEYRDGSGVGLSLSEVNPSYNYEGAMASREKVCACCMPKLEGLKIE